MTAKQKGPLVERAGDPARRTRNVFVQVPVSTRFWRKAREIASTRMKVSELFEIAMDKAIDAHVRDHGVALERKAAPLPAHTHWVFFRRDDTVYFYGKLAIGVDERCRLIGVGVAVNGGD